MKGWGERELAPSLLWMCYFIESSVMFQGAEGWRGRRRPWPSRGPRGVAPAVQGPPRKQGDRTRGWVSPNNDGVKMRKGPGGGRREGGLG